MILITGLRVVLVCGETYILDQCLHPKYQKVSSVSIAQESQVELQLSPQPEFETRDINPEGC